MAGTELLSCNRHVRKRDCHPTPGTRAPISKRSPRKYSEKTNDCAVISSLPDIFSRAFWFSTCVNCKIMASYKSTYLYERTPRNWQITTTKHCAGNVG